MQRGFLTSGDGNGQHCDATVFSICPLRCGRPTQVPDTAGNPWSVGDDGDAEHPGGEPVSRDEPEQYAESDASCVSGDAERVMHTGDNLRDRSDLKNGADDA